MPAERSSLPPEKIPRPPNAWILFRSDMSRQIDPNTCDSAGRPTRKTQAAVSKEISEMWRNVDPQTRNEYERRADARKAEHSIQYPNYRFAPVKKEDRQKLKEEKKQLKEQEKTNRRRARPAPYTPPATVSHTPMSSTPAPNHPQQNLPPFFYDPFLQGQAPSPPFSAHESPEVSSSSTEILQGNASLALHDGTTPPMPAPTPSGNHTLRLPSATEQSTPGPSHWQDQPEASSSASVWPGDSLQQNVSPGFVQFDVPHQPWESDDTMGALCSITGDPSVFQLDFDNQFFGNAALELSMNEPFDPSLFPDMRHFDFASLLEGVPPNNDLFTNNAPPIDPSLLGSDASIAFNGDEFINFEQTQSTSSRASSSTLPSTQYSTPAPALVPLPEQVKVPSPSPEPVSNSTYAPPSGASFSSQRRVAGSWPRAFAMESAGSPQPTQISASVN